MLCHRIVVIFTDSSVGHSFYLWHPSPQWISCWAPSFPCPSTQHHVLTVTVPFLPSHFLLSFSLSSLSLSCFCLLLLCCTFFFPSPFPLCPPSHSPEWDMLLVVGVSIWEVHPLVGPWDWAAYAFGSAAGEGKRSKDWPGRQLLEPLALHIIFVAPPIQPVTSFSANLLMGFDGQALVLLDPAFHSAGCNFFVFFLYEFSIASTPPRSFLTISP